MAVAAATRETVADVLRKHSVELPGNDLARTLSFVVFSVGVLFLVVDNPIFQVDAAAEGVKRFQQWSVLLLCLGLFLSVYSGVLVQQVLQQPTDRDVQYTPLFSGKMCISLAVVLFYAVVCLWVLVLGGILASPFATLLGMSPVLLTMQFLRDRHASYDRVFEALSPHLEKLPNDVLRRKHQVMKRAVLTASLCPLIMVFLTLSLGEWLVTYQSLHDYLLGGQFNSVCQSKWYVWVYHAVYYVSMLIAFVGVLPPRFTRRLTKKFLSPSSSIKG